MLILQGCCFIVSCLLVGVMAQESDITKFMKHLAVIPDVIDVGPKDFLKISYDSGVFADKGVELTPTQVRNEPKVEWTPEPGAEYTLLLTDPDAPSRVEPKNREFHHWLVGNIPGNDISKGVVLSAYIGSAPPDGTDLHRYVFLLFKQPKKLTFDEPRLTNSSAIGREHFNTKKFIEKYQLGEPVAGNFYQAKFDALVPELWKQLGITA